MGTFNNAQAFKEKSLKFAIMQKTALKLEECSYCHMDLKCLYCNVNVKLGGYIALTSDFQSATQQFSDGCD